MLRSTMNIVWLGVLLTLPSCKSTSPQPLPVAASRAAEIRSIKCERYAEGRSFRGCWTLEICPDGQAQLWLDGEGPFHLSLDLDKTARCFELGADVELRPLWGYVGPNQGHSSIELTIQTDDGEFHTMLKSDFGNITDEAIRRKMLPVMRVMYFMAGLTAQNNMRETREYFDSVFEEWGMR